MRSVFIFSSFSLICQANLHKNLGFLCQSNKKQDHLPLFRLIRTLGTQFFVITNPLSRYSKKRNRIELEILLPFDKFETANDSQCVEILKQSILDAIENYKNKNIPQQYIDVIVEKMKASINE